MKNIWRIYPKLTEVVRLDHHVYRMVATGHDFDHTLQVAQFTLFIAENEYVGRLAGAAGLCHNADRLLQKELGGVGKRDVPENRVVEMVTGWLGASGEFNKDQSAKIMKAVLRHSEPNIDDGDDVLVALQDADRIVCSMADVVMCAAQFRRELPAIHPKWLTVDPADTTAHSHRNPKSVLHNMECWYDWIDPASGVCVRLPKAKVLVERNVNFLRAYVAEIKAQRAEIGLWPNYPFES